MIPLLYAVPSQPFTLGATVGSESWESTSQALLVLRITVKRGLASWLSWHRWGLVTGHQPCDLSAWAVVAGNQPDRVLTTEATSDWTGVVDLPLRSGDPLLPALGRQLLSRPHAGAGQERGWEARLGYVPAVKGCFLCPRVNQLQG